MHAHGCIRTYTLSLLYAVITAYSLMLYMCIPILYTCVYLLLYALIKAFSRILYMCVYLLLYAVITEYSRMRAGHSHTLAHTHTHTAKTGEGRVSTGATVQEEGGSGL